MLTSIWTSQRDTSVSDEMKPNIWDTHQDRGMFSFLSFATYRMFNLKCSPNYHTRTNDETNYYITFLQPYSVVTGNELFEIGTVLSVILLVRWALVTDGHFYVSNFVPIELSVLFYHSVLLVRIRFRCEVMFEKEHKFCSWVRRVCVCAAGVSNEVAVRVTFTRVSRGRLGQCITRKWTCFWFDFYTVVRYCYWVAF